MYLLTGKCTSPNHFVFDQSTERSLFLALLFPFSWLPLNLHVPEENNAELMFFFRYVVVLFLDFFQPDFSHTHTQLI